MKRMKRIPFQCVHTPHQLILSGKGWEIREKLRQLARTRLTLEEYLRRVNPAGGRVRAGHPKNKRGPVSPFVP